VAKAKRTPGRRGGSPPPLDPIWAWNLYRSPAPPSPARARAIVAEANRRARTAALLGARQSTGLGEAITRGDYERAGALFRDQQERTVAPLVRRALAARDAAKQLKLTRAGNAAKRRRAVRRAAKYVKSAKDLRRKHPGWSLGAIVAHLRRTIAQPLSPSQIRRHLAAHGVK